MQKFLLGAYWTARRAPAEQCAEDASRFFAGLGELDPQLAHWYERGTSRRVTSAQRVETTNAKVLQDMLGKGRNRRDVGGEVMEDLGFRLGFWNGATDEGSEASLNVHCGSFNRRVGNNVLIHLPCSPDSTWLDNAAALLALVATVWRPDWAGIMSKRAIRERSMNADSPFVDWMVYVPRPIASVPSPGRVEAVAGLGSIVVVQPEPPSGDLADELARIEKVGGLLAA